MRRDTQALRQQRVRQSLGETLAAIAAQGIEAAAAAETVKLGSVHESPVGNADAPKSQSPKPYRGTPPMTPTPEMIEAGIRELNTSDMVYRDSQRAKDAAQVSRIYTAMESARDPDELREALLIFERVTRLADTLSCDVPINAGARRLITRAYEKLTALSRNRGDVGHG